MSWFSNLFSNKAQRYAQIAQANETKRQDEQAAADKAEYDAKLASQKEEYENAVDELNEKSEAALAEAEETARRAQKAAEEANYRASQTPADSEDARAAADRRMKKLQSQRGMASTIVSSRDTMGSASVATQQLLGA